MKKHLIENSFPAVCPLISRCGALFRRRESFFACVLLPLFLSVFTFSAPLSARVQQGPFVGIIYMPGGMAMQSVPYNDLPDNSGSVATKTVSGKELSSFSKLSLYGGYVYDRFYGQLNYSSSTVSNQVPDYANYTGGNISIDYRTIEFRAGMRFSDPGDSSYTGFFLGVRNSNYTTDYLGLNVNGTGMVSGVSAFYSLGCAWDVEFVAAGELYVANYYVTDIKADIDVDGAKKKETAAAGASLGLGFQYEPFNITFLFKGAFDYDQINNTTRFEGADVNRDIKMGAASFGFELMYRFYNFKHNK